MQTSSQLLHALLLLVAAAVSLRSVDAKNSILRDYNGKPVLAGVEYYMTSTIWGAGGGGVLPVQYPGGSSCPSYVGWAWSDLDAGVSVIIDSVNRPDAKSIRVDENVYIRFSKVDDCVKTPYWTLERVNGSDFVAIGGSVPELRSSTAVLGGNMFSFRKGSNGLEHAFALSYCPCNNNCKVACFKVGRSGANGQRILGSDFEVDYNVFLGRPPSPSAPAVVRPPSPSAPAFSDH